MSDLSDLHGVFPPSLRWNSEAGELLAVFTNEAFDREPRLVELNSSDATFAMDMATRERGYGLIGVGIYKMLLTPVGAPVPDLPEPIMVGGTPIAFKPALGVYVWNPAFGELRLETNAAYFRQAVNAAWERLRGYT